VPGIDRRWDGADATAGSPRPEASGADEGLRREYAPSYRAAVDAAYRDARSGSDGDGQPDGLPDDIHGLPDMARR